MSPEYLIQDFDAIFTILGDSFRMISDTTDRGLNTVIEVLPFETDKDPYLYYIGPEQPTLSTAIFAYCDLHNRDLTDLELRQVLADNVS